MDRTVVLTNIGEYMIRCKVDSPPEVVNSDFLLSVDELNLAKRNILAANSLYSCSTIKKGLVYVRIINPVTQNNKLFSGTRIRHVQCINDSDECVQKLDNDVDEDKSVVIGDIISKHQSHLSSSELTSLEGILKKYNSVFSRISTDFGCLKDIKHRINTGNSPPVAAGM